MSRARQRCEPRFLKTSSRYWYRMTRALWCAVVLLVLLGVGAAIERSAHVADSVARFEPARSAIMDALGRDDPLVLQRPADIDRFDRRFGHHPVLALLHVVPGGVFLALAPFQFVSALRRRYVAVHRWSGRILIVAAVVSVLSSFYFGLLIPFGGAGEAVAIAVFGGVFLLAIGRAFVAIRRRQIARHREWMIRAFAIAIGISSVRVMGAVLDVALTPAGLGPDTLFVLSIWTGWLLTACGAEAWIRQTRAHSV